MALRSRSHPASALSRNWARDRRARMCRASPRPPSCGCVPNDLFQFASSGPDFVGISSHEFWKLACKGAGSGQPATQRNYFDRALASVVSYYTDSPPTMPDFLSALRDAVPHLGLALPATPDYLRE